MIALSLTAPLAKAVARGFKTQTRRPLRPQPDPGVVEFVSAGPGRWRSVTAPFRLGDMFPGADAPDREVVWASGRLYKALHNPGDRLWIREPAISQGYTPDGRLHIKYVSDAAEAVVEHPARLKRVRDGQGLPNGCHLEAARTFVRVTAFRVERLTQITAADILAEGMGQPWNGLGIEAAGGMTAEHEAQLRAKWAALWNDIYPQAPWASDPWVTVTTFELEQP